MLREAAARYPSGENARIAATIDALTAERDELRTNLENWIRATYGAWAERDALTAERDRYRAVVDAARDLDGMIDLEEFYIGYLELTDAATDLRTALAALTEPEDPA